MKYIVGNWKMHLGIRESVALARGVLRSVRGQEESPEIVLAPSFTALAEVHKVLTRTKVRLSAQSCGPEKSGAYTGEVSVSMLKDVGCSHVIIGHSERRRLGESSESVNQKLKVALDAGLIPILCVGESLEVRESGDAVAFIKEELRDSIGGIRLGRKQNILVAYEPIWAIGTGSSAEVGDVVEMHSVIRNTLVELGIPDSQSLVLYGGSVDQNNAYDFLREQNIDGVLVGGASLKPRQFKGIIDAGQEVLAAQSL